MSLFTRDLISVERFQGAGAYTKGVYTKGTSLDFPARGNVQPVKPVEMLSLPEAQRTRETIKIFSTTELRPVEQTNSKSADRVTYNNEVYEVISVKNWGFSGIPHYVSLAQRINTNEAKRQV